MPDVRGLMADPEFQALPMERRKSILARINPELAAEYGGPVTPRTRGPALAGRQSELRQGKPQSAWSSAWDSVRQSIFGSEDRAEAKAAGIGLQPTPAELAEAALAGASFAGGSGTLAQGGARAGAAMLAKAKGVPGMVGRAMVTHPRTTGAVVDAAPELLRGDVTGAVGDAVTGAALGHLAAPVGRRLGRRFAAKPNPAAPPVPAVPADLDPAAAMKQAQALAAQGKTAEAQAIVEGLRRAGPVPAAGNVKPATIFQKGHYTNKHPDAVTGKVSEKGAALAEKQLALVGDNLDNPLIDPAARAASSAVKVDRGRAAASAHAKRVELAKQATAGTPFKGDSNGDQKVWMSLDDEGNPLEVITEHQAGALKKKGKPTTWVKRLWK